MGMPRKPFLAFACAHLTDERLYAAQVATLTAALRGVTLAPVWQPAPPGVPERTLQAYVEYARPALAAAISAVGGGPRPGSRGIIR